MNKNDKFDKYLNITRYFTNELTGLYDVVIKDEIIKLYIKDITFSLNTFLKIKEKIEKTSNQKITFSFFSVFARDDIKINIILTFHLEEGLI